MTTKKILITGLLGVAFLAAGCGKQANNANTSKSAGTFDDSNLNLQTPANNSPATNNNANTSASKSLTVTLSAKNKSGESGTATLTDLGNNQTRVVLALTGQPKDVPQPAHLHAGLCPGVGAVKYPLNAPLNGSSQTTINTSLTSLLNLLPLSINVHKADTEINTYVACGELHK